MKTKDQSAYDAWKAKQEDPYSLRCFSYAEDWASLMETDIEAGKSIADVADARGREADHDGITGFMHGMAVLILAECWIHGEELRRWHNLETQIGNEGERANEKGTVLNPALLSFGERTDG